jgi:VWFA-related protein
LGRTGLPGAIRIVARVSGSAGGEVAGVRFFVDGSLLGEDTDGPLYAQEWADANPFERTVITAQAHDSAGRVASDTVTLTPFEVTEVAEVKSVILEATVMDREGRFVRGLTQSGFTLEENDTPQTLDLVRPETLPATFTLLIDRSQSMHRRMDFVREASSRLAGYLGPKDRVVVAPFSQKVGPVTGPTDDLETVGHAIDAIRSEGGTAIVDCLKQAAELVAGVEGRHAIVLITDGYDEDSEVALDEALDTVGSSHATLYVIGIGGVAGISLKGERFMKELARRGGGRAFFPSREEELPAVHELVARDVQMRYLVGYTPSNQRADGTWRRVRLATVDPEYLVRTRPGYQAPSPPPIRPSIEFTIRGLDREYVDVTADELAVLEDGVEQQLDTFHEAVDPVSIVMLLDQSGSMVKAAEVVKASARSFVESLRIEDSLAVALFSDGLLFAHDLTRNRAHSVDAIGDYVARGGTALYDSVYGAVARLKSVEGRRVIVVLTDGRDENNPGTAPGSVRTLSEVIRAIKESRAIVFPIGLGPRVDQQVLSQLAWESGGEVFLPAEVADLSREYQRIVENLRRRYVVAYTSTNSARDGAWRSVEIRTVQASHVVESAGGYFAPER